MLEAPRGGSVDPVVGASPAGSQSTDTPQTGHRHDQTVREADRQTKVKFSARLSAGFKATCTYFRISLSETKGTNRGAGCWMWKRTGYRSLAHSHHVLILK